MHINVSENQVSISEASARFLESLLDKVSFQGSDGKFRAALAQKELKDGLAPYDPPPVANPPAPARPLQPSNRAARRHTP